MVLAHLVYFAYEAVLPISAVDSYGLTPAAWGFLVIINPALVTIFQLRLTRRVERFPAAPKFALAMILMGWPFLLLSVNASIAILALVILIFVVGEMLWIPTSQAIAAGSRRPTSAARTWVPSRARRRWASRSARSSASRCEASSATPRCGASSQARPWPAPSSASSPAATRSRFGRRA